MVVWLFGWFGSLVVCMVWFEEIYFDYYLSWVDAVAHPPKRGRRTDSIAGLTRIERTICTQHADAGTY